MATHQQAKDWLEREKLRFEIEKAKNEIELSRCPPCWQTWLPPWITAIATVGIGALTVYVATTTGVLDVARLNFEKSELALDNKTAERKRAGLQQTYDRLKADSAALKQEREQLIDAQRHLLVDVSNTREELTKQTRAKELMEGEAAKARSELIESKSEAEKLRKQVASLRTEKEAGEKALVEVQAAKSAIEQQLRSLKVRTQQAEQRLALIPLREKTVAIVYHRDTGRTAGALKQKLEQLGLKTHYLDVNTLGPGGLDQLAYQRLANAERDARPQFFTGLHDADGTIVVCRDDPAILDSYRALVGARDSTSSADAEDLIPVLQTARLLPTKDMRYYDLIIVMMPPTAGR